VSGDEPLSRPVEREPGDREEEPDIDTISVTEFNEGTLGIFPFPSFSCYIFGRSTRPFSKLTLFLIASPSLPPRVQSKLPCDDDSKSMLTYPSAIELLLLCGGEASVLTGTIQGGGSSICEGITPTLPKVGSTSATPATPSSSIAVPS